MKRTILIASVLLIGVAGTYLAFAQEGDNTIPPYTPPFDPNAVEGVPVKRCPMCMMMGQSMLQSQIVPLSDGGVLVMMGNTLYKYDQNLNLVSQVQIEIDAQQLQSQMQQLMQNCPMCAQKQPMRQGWRGGQTDGETNGQTNGAGEEKTKSKPEQESKSQTKAAKEQS